LGEHRKMSRLKCEKKINSRVIYLSLSLWAAKTLAHCSSIVRIGR